MWSLLGYGSTNTLAEGQQQHQLPASQSQQDPQPTVQPPPQLQSDPLQSTAPPLLKSTPQSQSDPAQSIPIKDLTMDNDDDDDDEKMFTTFIQSIPVQPVSKFMNETDLNLKNCNEVEYQKNLTCIQDHLMEKFKNHPLANEYQKFNDYIKISIDDKILNKFINTKEIISDHKKHMLIAACAGLKHKTYVTDMYEVYHELYSVKYAIEWILKRLESVISVTISPVFENTYLGDGGFSLMIELIFERTMSTLKSKNYTVTQEKGKVDFTIYANPPILRDGELFYNTDFGPFINNVYIKLRDIEKNKDMNQSKTNDGILFFKKINPENVKDGMIVITEDWQKTPLKPRPIFLAKYYGPTNNVKYFSYPDDVRTLNKEWLCYEAISDFIPDPINYRGTFEIDYQEIII